MNTATAPSPVRPAGTPEHRFAVARDLANHHRRHGRRVVLVAGAFDSIEPSHILAVLGQTSDHDGLIVAVGADPADATHDLESRLRLAGAFRDFDYALPIAGPAVELAAFIGADLVINLSEPRDPAVAAEDDPPGLESRDPAGLAPAGTQTRPNSNSHIRTHS